MNLRRPLSLILSLSVALVSETPWAAEWRYAPPVATGHASLQTIAAQSQGWLGGDSIARVISGNTSEANFLEGSNVQLLYWSPDHRVISKARNKAPIYVGDWYVTNAGLCIHARGGDFCYYVRNAGNYLEGWAIKPQGTNRSLLLAMYRGDAFELVKQRREFQEGYSWESVASLLGLAIVGTALVAMLSGEGSHTASGGGGEEYELRIDENPSSPREAGSSPPVEPVGGRCGLYGDTHGVGDCP